MNAVSPLLPALGPSLIAWLVAGAVAIAPFLPS